MHAELLKVTLYSRRWLAISYNITIVQHCTMSRTIYVRTGKNYVAV